ncbi:helix-turn-helix domain-containing protein [Gordonia polyisoprenivorans]|uniref:helix-turn-helix domain-containing protein n=1 Tax=Gordonia polyisoprenivorans TaxID=84595 RepID=UPI000360B6E4|nr:helix-turn-helix domain-containing protein [Gordonia polyisoprenivorans]
MLQDNDDTVDHRLATDPAAGRSSTLDQAEKLEGALTDIDIALAVRVPPIERADPIGVQMQQRTYPELTVVNMRCGPVSAARTSRQIAKADNALMAALLVRSGDELVRQDGSTSLLRPGDLLLWDCTRPAHFQVGTSIEKRLMIVPEGVFNAVGAERPSARGLTIIRQSSATRLLDHFLDSLLTAGDELSPAAATAARNAALELLVGSLHRDPSTAIPASSIALRQSIERWIDQHLGDANITPALVAAAHAISVRTVHRMFAETGDTLGSVIRMRRLLRARRELECTHHSITAIASRWGFSDSSHFTRTFKRQFDISPSDHRMRYQNGERVSSEQDETVGATVQLPITWH